MDHFKKNITKNWSQLVKKDLVRLSAIRSDTQSIADHWAPWQEPRRLDGWRLVTDNSPMKWHLTKRLEQTVRMAPIKCDMQWCLKYALKILFICFRIFDTFSWTNTFYYSSTNQKIILYFSLYIKSRAGPKPLFAG